MRKYVIIGLTILLAFFISSCDLNLFNSFEQVPSYSSDDLSSGLKGGGVTVSDDGEITDLGDSITVSGGTVTVSSSIKDYTRSIEEMVAYGTIDDLSEEDLKKTADNLKKIADKFVEELSGDDFDETSVDNPEEVREIVQQASGISMDLQVAANEDVKNFITGTSDIIVGLLGSLSDESRSAGSARALTEDGTTYEHLSGTVEFNFGTDTSTTAFDDFADELYGVFGDDDITESEKQNIIDTFKTNLNDELDSAAPGDLEISLIDLLLLFPADSLPEFVPVVKGIAEKLPLETQEEFEDFLDSFDGINQTAKQFFWSIGIDADGAVSGMSKVYYDAEEERFTAGAKNISLRAMLALFFEAMEDSVGDRGTMYDLLSVLGTSSGVTIEPSDSGGSNMTVTINDVDKADIENIDFDIESMFSEGTPEEKRMKKAAAVLGFYGLIFSEDSE